MGDDVTIPRAAAEALIRFWQAWDECDVYDADGQPGIWTLVGVEGGRRLDDAYEDAEPHVAAVRERLKGF